ncbi:MAG TPA: hypothetical protein VKI00_07280 [Mycobacterium sp.]|uniref:hypothetical protein n=1 Tax=Mycobacterium sp. TaxID=1785 RepID=UPI002D0629E5|nr:hypothetical protein [Mycobacterium sp.]HME75453.1 hypothetical protein [Mycobacterium sp.]
MDIRKIAVVGSFAAGAALALAPLASAAPTDPLISVVGSEESLLNSLFVGDASLAGDSSDVTAPTATNPFDIITPSDISTVQGTGTTPFDYLIYGLDPLKAGLATDPGSYNVLNGALTEWADAYNIELYSLLNPSAAIDTIPAADLIGSTETIQDAFAAGPTAADVATYFYEFGANDLAGYLDLPSFFPSLVP